MRLWSLRLILDHPSAWAVRRFSKKFHRGTCRFEDGKYVITTEQQMPGLVRRVQLSVKNHTGKKFKFVHGDKTAGDEEGDAPEAAQTENEPASGGGGSPQGDANPQGDASPQDDATAADAAKPQGSAAAGPPKPSDEPLEDMKKPFMIGGAVGRGGKNKPEDVQAVQTALNLKAKSNLKVDGQCGPKTIAAIMAFQKPELVIRRTKRPPIDT